MSQCRSCPPVVEGNSTGVTNNINDVSVRHDTRGPELEHLKENTAVINIISSTCASVCLPKGIIKV